MKNRITLLTAPPKSPPHFLPWRLGEVYDGGVEILDRDDDEVFPAPRDPDGGTTIARRIVDAANSAIPKQEVVGVQLRLTVEELKTIQALAGCINSEELPGIEAPLGSLFDDLSRHIYGDACLEALNGGQVFRGANELRFDSTYLPTQEVSE